MRINEVEKIVGISKKNIRFYEKEGLLSPDRSKDNGYRDYNDEDVACLEQIKLLRKLGIPIDEIRSLQKGNSTVADAMRRHLVTLERSKQNINNSIEFCTALKSEEKLLKDLDAHQCLLQMEEMESKGASFNNIHVRDVKSAQYMGAVIASAVMIAFMVIIFLIMLLTFKEETEVPFFFKVVLLSAPAVICLGVLYALMQRIREIGKGEIDDARRF